MKTSVCAVRKTRKFAILLPKADFKSAPPRSNKEDERALGKRA